MKRARRKHQEAVLEFSKSVYEEIPKVVLAAASRTRGRVCWDMSKSNAFVKMAEENKYFLLGESSLEPEEWKAVFDSVVSQLKTVQDMAWKIYNPDDPTTVSSITLIWDQRVSK